MKRKIQIKENFTSTIFFVLFICIIAFRLSFMENSTIESFSLIGIFYDNFISICISCILLISALVCLTFIPAVRKHTGIEAGAFLFFIAIIVSTYFASNKRAALNDSLTIFSIIIAAIALAGLLNSDTKRKILLFFIIAMGVVNVYQCTDQFFNANKMMIEEYKSNPEDQLRQLGIEPGSFAQMLYEHRLYSKDVKGFFSTSNSAGSFFNLAIFSAIAVFGAGLKKHRKNLKEIILPTVLILVLFSGLLLTASKGALVSFAAAFFVLCCVYFFGKFLNSHKILIFSAIGICFIAGILLMISYGLKHNTLPGGNSMLVRWQYWTAAAAMIADHFFTGVGGNNFGSFYTFYKIPESLETIRDPHCFVLSIFSSYGIIGLAGFCAALFVPVIRALKNINHKITQEKNEFVFMVKYCSTSATFILLFLRPLAIRSGLGGRFDVALYIIAMLYVAPIFFFGTSLWLFAKSKKICEDFPVATAPLLCGILAVLLHNLIDFGMFEPGILTALLAVIALIVSQSSDFGNIKIRPRLKYLSIILTAAVVFVCLWLFIIPIGKTAVKMETAKELSSYGNYNKASAILSTAIKDDVFNSAPAALDGMVEMYSFQILPSENLDKLSNAEKAVRIAIARDPQDFKNYEQLAKVYQAYAEAKPDQRLLWFDKAFTALNQAIAVYPSSTDLHLSAATIAQQLGKTDYAIEHYTRAVAIEDAYREQFKIMYPGKEVFSRLGDVNYNFAKDKLEQLIKEKDNKNK